MNAVVKKTPKTEAKDKAALTLPKETRTQLAEITKTEFWLITAEVNYKDVPDVTTKEGMVIAKERRADCVSTRTGCDKARKAATLPLREEVSRINDLWSKDYQPRILALEGPLDKAIKAEDERKAKLKAEKVEKEKKRTDAIELSINTVSALATTALAVIDIDKALAYIKALDPEAFDEFKDKAHQVIVGTENTLERRRDTLTEQAAEAERLENQRVAQEAATQKLADQQAELDRKQAEADKRDQDYADKLAEDKRIKDAADAKRVAAIQAKLDKIIELPETLIHSNEADSLLKVLTSIDVLDFDEYADGAAKAISQSKTNIATMASRMKEAEDQAEARRIADEEEANRKQQEADDAAETKRLADIETVRLQAVADEQARVKAEADKKTKAQAKADRLAAAAPDKKKLQDWLDAMPTMKTDAGEMASRAIHDHAVNAISAIDSQVDQEAA